LTKPEWGTKRSCPKCGTRFYDLGSDDPVTCIECGTAWEPEPMLKSKQPLPFEVAKKEVDEAADADAMDSDDLDVDLDVDDGEVNPDDEIDVGGDDDLSEVAKSKGDDEEA
jgi:uncharacterized protein (TIGR02300 family)